jgi:hypothetical protein
MILESANSLEGDIGVNDIFKFHVLRHRLNYAYPGQDLASGILNIQIQPD